MGERGGVAGFSDSLCVSVSHWFVLTLRISGHTGNVTVSSLCLRSITEGNERKGDIASLKMERSGRSLRIGSRLSTKVRWKASGCACFVSLDEHRSFGYL
jgi:hypothetical protein